MTLKEAKEFTGWIGGIFIIAYVIVVLIGLSPIGRDDSDPGSWGSRSELNIRTDSLTGCQYLEARNGGLAKRLDSEGNHLGCYKKGG